MKAIKRLEAKLATAQKRLDAADDKWRNSYTDYEERMAQERSTKWSERIEELEAEIERLSNS